MKFMKTIALSTALLIGTATAAMCEVKIALDSPPDLQKSGSYVWAHAFGDYLTKHGMKVRELPRGAIGGEAEKLDQASTGLLEVSLSDVKSVAKIDPFIYGVRLPYLFDNAAHLDRVLAAGHVFARINKNIAKSSVRLLALVPLGPSSGIITTKHAVHTPADMADLRMRALDDSQIALYKAWGSTGTIVPWREISTAMQTGVVDGYLNSALVPVMFGQTDIVKYFTDAGVIIPLRAVIVSKSWYDGLSEKQRATVTAAVKAGNAANRTWLKEVGSKALKTLAKAGVKVIELTADQRAKFRKLAQKAYNSGLLPAKSVAVWVKLANSTR